MASRFAEQVWYLLTIFNCLGYLVLFVIVVFWLRLMLHVMEDALAPLTQRRRPAIPFPTRRVPAEASPAAQPGSAGLPQAS